MPMAATSTISWLVGWGLGENRANRKGTDGGEYDEFEFHMLCLMTGRIRRRLQDFLEPGSENGKFVTEARAGRSFPLVWKPLG